MNGSQPEVQRKDPEYPSTICGRVANLGYCFPKVAVCPLQGVLFPLDVWCSRRWLFWGCRGGYCKSNLVCSKTPSWVCSLDGKVCTSLPFGCCSSLEAVETVKRICYNTFSFYDKPCLLLQNSPKRAFSEEIRSWRGVFYRWGIKAYQLLVPSRCTILPKLNLIHLPLYINCCGWKYDHCREHYSKHTMPMKQMLSVQSMFC